jgi:outer membrane protein assembly factor BamA
MTRALLLLLLVLVGCAKHEPPPWLTSVRVTGPDPRPGIAGLTDDPDLPPIGPHLSDAFASRRTMWSVKTEVEHPWSRWWQFIPFAPTVLGYRRSTIDEAVLRQDAERIRTFFADRGWQATTVDLELGPPTLWIARLFRDPEANRTLEAWFKVDVGTRHRLATFEMFGDPVEVPLPEVGSPWGATLEADLLAKLQFAAETDGHGRADVWISEAADRTGAAQVEAYVDRGPRVRFGELTFSGNTDLSDAALRRTVRRVVAEGAWWDPKRVERLEKRLLRTPGVASITIDKVDHPNPGIVPLHVTVTETPRDVVEPANEIIGRPGTFTLIVGAEWTRRHVFGRNTRTRLLAAGGYRHIWRDVWAGDSGPAAQFGLGMDYSLDPVSSSFLHMSIDSEMDQWHGFHYGSADAEFGPSWERGPLSIWGGVRSSGFLAFSYPLQKATFDRFFEFQDTGNRPLERSYLLHQGVVHLELDSIRDPVNPRQGARWMLDAIPYGRVEGATLRRIETDLDMYWPTALDLLTLRTRVGGGLLDVQPSEFLDADEAPGLLLGHRLYGGGPSLVRSWSDRGILPPGTEWEPGEPRTGGDAEFHATIEPRLHVHPHATLTTFLDAASVWEDPRDISFDTLRWSTGFGVRFPLVIGEGHLIFAWLVGKPQQDRQGGRLVIHLTLDGY